MARQQAHDAGIGTEYHQHNTVAAGVSTTALSHASMPDIAFRIE